MILLLYVIVGIVLDIIITRYTQAIMQKEAINSGLLSFIITIVNVFIYKYIILSTEFMQGAIAFAIGCGIGTILMVNKNKKHEKN